MRLNELLATTLKPAESRRGMHWHAGMYTSMSPAMLNEIQTISRITQGAATSSAVQAAAIRNAVPRNIRRNSPPETPAPRPRAPLQTGSSDG